jgi:CO/xanthine dehydrogenase FAD-binding subunit
MKPRPFRYFAPRTAEAALALLAEHGENARLLAGGQSLVPLMNLRMGRPEVLIDLGHCAGLAYIERRGDRVAYGPMTRQIDAETSPVTKGACPLVAQALAYAGPIAVRNRATVGGTLAHADRAAELPGVALALDATFVVEGPNGQRMVPAEKFFLGDLTTDVKTGELLREVQFPILPEPSFTTFLELGTRQRDMALGGIAACLVLDRGGVCREARFAAIGVEPAPVRLGATEAALRQKPLTRELAGAAARQAAAAVQPDSDVHATARYRRHLVATLVERALEQALRWHEGRHVH